nr:MAG TPA: hypothetical protein [Caudoviricetes sp.]
MINTKLTHKLFANLFVQKSFLLTFDNQLLLFT